MAQREDKINLQNRMIPMLSEQMGRSVIGDTKEELYDSDQRPKVYYAHNVMPSSYGLDSVGFQEVIPAPVIADNTFLDIREIYGSLKSRIQLAWNERGEVYVLDLGATKWLKLPETDPITSSE